MERQDQIEDLKTEMKEMKGMFRVLFSLIKENNKDIELEDDYKSFTEFLEEKALGNK